MAWLERRREGRKEGERRQVESEPEMKLGEANGFEEE